MLENGRSTLDCVIAIDSARRQLNAFARLAGASDAEAVLACGSHGITISARGPEGDISMAIPGTVYVGGAVALPFNTLQSCVRSLDPVRKAHVHVDSYGTLTIGQDTASISTAAVSKDEGLPHPQATLSDDTVCANGPQLGLSFQLASQYLNHFPRSRVSERDLGSRQRIEVREQPGALVVGVVDPYVACLTSIPVIGGRSDPSRTAAISRSALACLAGLDLAKKTRVGVAPVLSITCGDDLNMIIRGVTSEGVNIDVLRGFQFENSARVSAPELRKGLLGFSVLNQLRPRDRIEVGDGRVRVTGEDERYSATAEAAAIGESLGAFRLPSRLVEFLATIGVGELVLALDDRRRILRVSGHDPVEFETFTAVGA
jgi:hypothetical protein